VTTATIVLWLISFILIILAWVKKDDSLKKGFELAWQTARRNVALMMVAFVIVGYVNVLSPTDLIQAWIGPGTGFRGILLGELIGMLLPGGPYVVFPLIAILYQAGAGLGPAVTIITSWSTQALLTIGFELPFMGWRFTAVRWGLGLVVPLVAGVVAALFFG
jgi:uncharacterized membrane protein YraQ (UPF0718 family)